MKNQNETFVYFKKKENNYSFFKISKNELLNPKNFLEQNKINKNLKIDVQKFIKLQNAITDNFYFFIDFQNKKMFFSEFHKEHERFLKINLQLANVVSDKKQLKQLLNSETQKLFDTYLNNLFIANYLDVIKWYSSDICEIERANKEFLNSWLGKYKLMNEVEATNFLKEIIYFSGD